VCPVCLGLPGHRPLLNRKAVEYAIKAALALNCRCSPYTTFDRKNYFYCDLPKGIRYPSSSTPWVPTGTWTSTWTGKTARIGLRQIHLEEDTGKLLHSGSIVEASFQPGGF
jgi:aspartyl-tRNA(Asn)/glutamyl-tRNA(Gln) amidotransferase subunit B